MTKATRTVTPHWLRPSWAGLDALTTDRPDWSVVRDDPGLTVHFLRFGRPTPKSLRAAAAGLLAEPTPYVDWTTTPDGAGWCRFGRLAARVCRGLAAEAGTVRPAEAWVAGLLAPLGWYAITAGAPPTVPAAAYTRRLAVRWRLPAWLGDVVSWLHFAQADAVGLGADPQLYQIVRAGVSAVERVLCRPGAVTGEIDPSRNPLSDRADDKAAREVDTDPWADPVPRTVHADAVVMMARVLKLTARTSDADRDDSIRRHEGQVDTLVGMVSASRREFDTAVRDARLSGLAEFAAGASHEINNPLTIIAGHAKRLGAGETDITRKAGFDAIGRAARRIHELLSATRQFARPSVPSQHSLDLATWLSDRQAELRTVAAESGAYFDVVITGEGSFPVVADPDQLLAALTHLVRNGGEAAGRNGWVRVTLAAIPGTIRMAVEDSGSGPPADVVPYLFDPFFCGRPAGRRPGLGLSVAWRLAEVNNGQLTFAPTTRSLSRFLLSFPTDGHTMERSPESVRRSA